MSHNGHGPTPTWRQALALGALALDAQADGMPDAGGGAIADGVYWIPFHAAPSA